MRKYIRTLLRRPYVKVWYFQDGHIRKRILRSGHSFDVQELLVNSGAEVTLVRVEVE